MAYLVDSYESLIFAFESVLAAVKQLCLHIHDDLINYPVWADNGAGEFIADRDIVIHALQYFSPVMSLTPQETFSCPGVVACTEQTFTLIDEVNRFKDEFRNVAREYLHIFKGNPTKTVRSILASAGYGGVMLKQVYRHLYKISFYPHSIRWSKAQTGSHVVIDKEEARHRLLKLGAEEKHISIQLSKLNLLTDSTKLVVHHKIKKCWITNIAPLNPESIQGKKHVMRSSLPIFYLHDVNAPLPIVCFSKQKIKMGTTQQNKLIEDKPFLKSIRAYRYIGTTKKSINV